MSVYSRVSVNRICNVFWRGVAVLAPKTAVGASRAASVLSGYNPGFERNQFQTPVNFSFGRPAGGLLGDHNIDLVRTVEDHCPGIDLRRFSEKTEAVLSALGLRRIILSSSLDRGQLRQVLGSIVKEEPAALLDGLKRVRNLVAETTGSELYLTSAYEYRNIRQERDLRIAETKAAIASAVESRELGDILEAFGVVSISLYSGWEGEDKNPDGIKAVRSQLIYSAPDLGPRPTTLEKLRELDPKNIPADEKIWLAINQGRGTVVPLGDTGRKDRRHDGQLLTILVPERKYSREKGPARIFRLEVKANKYFDVNLIKDYEDCAGNDFLRLLLLNIASKYYRLYREEKETESIGQLVEAIRRADQALKSRIWETDISDLVAASLIGSLSVPLIDACAVRLLNPDTGLWEEGSQGFAAGDEEVLVFLRSENGLLQSAIRQSCEQAVNEFFIVTRPAAEGRPAEFRNYNLLALPVADRTGQTFGSLAFIIRDRDQSEIFRRPAVRHQLANYSRMVSDHLEIIGQLRRDSNGTALYNKQYFRLLLRQAIAKSAKDKGRISLIVFDFDNLKKFNSLFGPPRVDRIFELLGELSRDYFKPAGGAGLYGPVCRWGGDEFAIILTGLDEAETDRIAQSFSRMVAEDLIRKVGKRYPEFGGWLKAQGIDKITVSLGWGTIDLDPERIHPETRSKIVRHGINLDIDPADAEEVSSAADQIETAIFDALGRAKEKEGKGSCTAVFDIPPPGGEQNGK